MRHSKLSARRPIVARVVAVRPKRAGSKFMLSLSTAMILSGLLALLWMASDYSYFASESSNRHFHQHSPHKVIVVPSEGHGTPVFSISSVKITVGKQGHQHDEGIPTGPGFMDQFGMDEELQRLLMKEVSSDSNNFQTPEDLLFKNGIEHIEEFLPIQHAAVKPVDPKPTEAKTEVESKENEVENVKRAKRSSMDYFKFFTTGGGALDNVQSDFAEEEVMRGQDEVPEVQEDMNRIPGVLRFKTPPPPDYYEYSPKDERPFLSSNQQCLLGGLGLILLGALGVAMYLCEPEKEEELKISAASGKDEEKGAEPQTEDTADAEGDATEDMESLIE